MKLELNISDIITEAQYIAERTAQQVGSESVILSEYDEETIDRAVNEALVQLSAENYLLDVRCNTEDGKAIICADIPNDNYSAIADSAKHYIARAIVRQWYMDVLPTAVEQAVTYEASAYGTLLKLMYKRNQPTR